MLKNLDNVSKDNVNSVTLDVITSSKGTITSCIGLGSILKSRKKGYDTTPLIIRQVGKITDTDFDSSGNNALNSNGYLEVIPCFLLCREQIRKQEVRFQMKLEE